MNLESPTRGKEVRQCKSLRLLHLDFYMRSHFQNGLLLPRLGDATSSKSIRTKTDREKACHDKNNSTVTEFIFLPQLQ
jgi:hypothetical protein